MTYHLIQANVLAIWYQMLRMGAGLQSSALVPAFPEPAYISAEQ